MTQYDTAEMLRLFNDMQEKAFKNIHSIREVKSTLITSVEVRAEASAVNGGPQITTFFKINGKQHDITLPIPEHEKDPGKLRRAMCRAMAEELTGMFMKAVDNELFSTSLHTRA